MKPNLKIKINSKETKPQLKSSNNTPKHKYSSSLTTATSIAKFPSSTRAKPSFSSFLSPNASKLFSTPKHSHSSSLQFPISPQNARLIKIPKLEAIEDMAKWRSIQLPVSPEKVISEFKLHLIHYEESEILSFPEVYFIGIGVSKPKSGVKNHGFDDEEGEYKVIIGDHLAYRYEIITTLGSGSFGKVVKVFDHKEKEQFAIKIIKNKPRFHEQAREEIEILNYLKSRNPDNSFCIIQMLDCFNFRNHSCIKFELLGINLYQYLKTNNFQGCSYDLLKRIAGQILQALRLMDRFKVIHCDLKPENILLLNNSLDIKVIDFGSASFYEKRMYTYIQSRYYRAPEVILGLDYSTAIDMWSFGCILAELLTGRPIFPGESEADQIQCMMEVLGPPPLKVINKATRKNLYFELDGKPKLIISAKGKKRVCGSKKLKDVLKCSDERLLNLISGCFEWDQLKRISPDEALLHPWLNESSQQGLKFKHTKTQSESVLKMNKLFTIKETYFA